MKKIHALISILLMSYVVNAQCVIKHTSLNERVEQSSVVVEAKVINQESLWDKNHYNIYTINTLKVFKYFKGSATDTLVYLVTKGGQVGLERHEAFPSLSLQIGEVGVFLLKHCSISFKTMSELYEASASIESFVKYDLENVMAYDVDHNYYSIRFDFYEKLKALTGQEHIEVKYFDPESKRKQIKALANPIINAIDIDTVASGTDMLITITGSNFGIVRGIGKVGFKDANYGDGRFYYSPLSDSYESWSNSQIKIKVPTRAGTGPIQIVNNNGESGTSSFNLYVKWAHSNVLFGTTGADTLFYQPTHIGDNSNGGYTWHMTHQFAANSDAVKAMYRSLETWRCGTLMNWEVGKDTSIDQTASDNVNIVRFDDLSGNTLGTCWSRWSGCYSPSTFTYYWYVRELDIEFDSTYNWYYGTGNTPSNQMDFQSVATHELGHGHQLSHVIDNSKVMHYALGPGYKNDHLSEYDIEGGIYVKDRSTSNSVCSKSAMSALSSGSCQITLPVVSFNISDTIVCPGDDVVFTNQTTGNGLQFKWNFGSGASIDTSNTMGPHTLQYNSSGNVTIRLIVQNGFGADTLDRNLIVLPPAPETPLPFIDFDTACIAEYTYTIDSVANDEGYVWAVSAGGSFVGGSTGRTVKINWTNSGLKTINVVAQNQCGNSALLKDSLTILDFPVAAFSEAINGLDVEFTSLSQHASEYIWSFGDGNGSNASDPLYSFGDKGQYTVKLKVLNYCGSDSISKSISLDFKAGVVEFNKEIGVYPNPVKSGQSITVSGISGFDLEIIDMQGKTVLTNKPHSNTIQLPKLETGIYVLKLNRAKEIGYLKLIICNE